MPKFHRIAVIANPASQNGAGRAASRRVERCLLDAVGAGAFSLHETKGPRHAQGLARELAATHDAVVVIGGDGAVHEAANGLMELLPDARPALGVVPVGSGNDYAFTLGMPAKIEEAVARILEGKVRKLDVGRCNGEHFVQTLSFGLDAAIALDTVERRKRTGRTGTALYLESGIDQLLHHRDAFHYNVELIGADGAPPDARTAIEGDSFIFAVQIGPTYGGHFKICPEASASDGAFDVCLAHPPLSALSAVGIFLLAKEGLHVRFKRIELHRVRGLRIRFDREPAAQMDGEKLTGRCFEVDTVPGALTVVMGSRG